MSQLLSSSDTEMWLWGSQVVNSDLGRVAFGEGRELTRNMMSPIAEAAIYFLGNSGANNLALVDFFFKLSTRLKLEQPIDKNMVISKYFVKSKDTEEPVFCVGLHWS